MAWPKGEKAPKEWKDWQPKEFKPTHCTQLIMLMSQGKGPQSFNAANNLSQATFYRWVKEYPDFATAYEIAKQKCDDYLLGLLHEHKIESKADGSVSLNMHVWREINKTSRLAHDKKETTLGVNLSGNHNTMMTSVLHGLTVGVIGIEEAQKLAELIGKAQDIEERGELVKRVEELENALKNGITVEEFEEE